MVDLRLPSESRWTVAMIEFPEIFVSIEEVLSGAMDSATKIGCLEKMQKVAFTIMPPVMCEEFQIMTFNPIISSRFRDYR
jgi:hypothetical protein